MSMTTAAATCFFSCLLCHFASRMHELARDGLHRACRHTSAAPPAGPRTVTSTVSQHIQYFQQILESHERPGWHRFTCFAALSNGVEHSQVSSTTLAGAQPSACCCRPHSADPSAVTATPPCCLPLAGALPVASISGLSQGHLHRLGGRVSSVVQPDGPRLTGWLVGL